jgi:hypothetical protein
MAVGLLRAYPEQHFKLQRCRQERLTKEYNGVAFLVGPQMPLLRHFAAQEECPRRVSATTLSVSQFAQYLCAFFKMMARSIGLVDAGAFLSNVFCSVFIVFVNKVLMDRRNGYGFVFATTLCALHFFASAGVVRLNEAIGYSQGAELPIKGACQLFFSTKPPLGKVFYLMKSMNVRPVLQTLLCFP